MRQALIFGAIAFEFLLYILVRQVVNVIEWSASCASTPLSPPPRHFVGSPRVAGTLTCG